MYDILQENWHGLLKNTIPLKKMLGGCFRIKETKEPYNQMQGRKTKAKVLSSHW